MNEPMITWRVGSKVPLNVYDGDRPVCQCHSEEDAARIVAAMNGGAEARKDTEKSRDLLDRALKGVRVLETITDAAGFYVAANVSANLRAHLEAYLDAVRTQEGATPED